MENTCCCPDRRRHISNAIEGPRRVELHMMSNCGEWICEGYE